MKVSFSSLVSKRAYLKVPCSQSLHFSKSRLLVCIPSRSSTSSHNAQIITAKPAAISRVRTGLERAACAKSLNSAKPRSGNAPASQRRTPAITPKPFLNRDDIRESLLSEGLEDRADYQRLPDLQTEIE